MSSPVSESAYVYESTRLMSEYWRELYAGGGALMQDHRLEGPLGC